jgi:hypothetical protein
MIASNAMLASAHELLIPFFIYLKEKQREAVRGVRQHGARSFGLRSCVRFLPV